MRSVAEGGQWTATDEQAASQWHERVQGDYERISQATFPAADPAPLFNPFNEQLDTEAAVLPWKAFPGPVANAEGLEPLERLEKAEKRVEQVEYCEWVSRREGDELVAVTFTTEVPEYFEVLHDADPNALLALYRDWVDDGLELTELRDGGGGYSRDRVKKIEEDNPGAIIHLSAGPNNLGAAISLVAEATKVRTDENGQQITDKDQIVHCSSLGEADRNSDPFIAATVNGAAALGTRVALADPIGPFIKEIRMEGMTLADGPTSKLSEFWRPERRMGQKVVRATFAAPDGSPLSQVLLEGRPITHGAQIADRVEVAIAALIADVGIEPVTEAC